ncbi:MAG TPA: glycosyltransferase family 39 protein [Aggregatilineales bacterium]|nr:glycosyltransferase family 39 protein [Aggregatilineales bacterium]
MLPGVSSPGWSEELISTRRTRRLTATQVAAILLAFFTFVAADFVSKTVFERLPHLEDEFGYLFQAKIFARGQAWVVRANDDPVKYFWQPFVLQPETAVDGVYKRFGKYTPGWPLLLSFGVIVGQWWVVNAFLAMLAVALTYRLGKEIFDESVGVVSALLLAISPMALLLNGTLMSHISAMFMAALFVYGYWRVTRGKRGRFAWAVVAGLAIGWVAATRPLTAVAIAAPVALHALASLFETPPVREEDESTRIEIPATASARVQILVKVLAPLVVLALAALPTTGLWPLFNQIWTGDWRTNTYTLLWPYDQVGFGPDHGLMQFAGCDSRYGCHTLEFGLTNARTDLEVYMRDLFGFTMSPGIEKYIRDNMGWGAGIGLSWILVVAGLIAGRKKEWIWVFFELFVAIVIAQLFYWIGSVVRGGAAYSLRYYYEATFGVCLVAGFGAVTIIRNLRSKRQKQEIATPLPAQPGTPIDYLNGAPSGRALKEKGSTVLTRLERAWQVLWPGYILLEIAVMASLMGYTPARFHEPLPPNWTDGLYGYNKVSQSPIDDLNQVREEAGHPDQPVLLLILNDPAPGTSDDWRDYGAAMALESPFLDGDIVVVRIFDAENAPAVIQRFPGRLVLYQVGSRIDPSMEKLIGDTTTSGDK